MKNPDLLSRIFALLIGLYACNAGATTNFPPLTPGNDYFTNSAGVLYNVCKGSTPEAAAACTTNYFLSVPPPTGCNTSNNDPTYACLPPNDPAYVTSNFGCTAPHFCVFHLGVIKVANYSGPACATGHTDSSGNCNEPPPRRDPGNRGPALCATPVSAAAPLGKANFGMCGTSARLMQVSLSLNDTPVGYAPPIGPAVYVRLSYNHKEASQPATFTYFNVGPQWSLNVTSFITDDPATAGANVTRATPGGGYIGNVPLAFNSTTGAFTTEQETGAVLVRIPASGTVTSYELRFPDGTKHVYSAFDGASTYPRRVFLSQIVDPQGNALSFTYDGSMRLTTITDAVSRATTFSYTHTNPLLVTRITDPFGRHADLTYDGSGRLDSITDVIGITSSFTWDTTDATLISAMTTPYGTTSYTYGESDYGQDTNWLEITDRLGKITRIESAPNATGIISPPSNQPTAMSIGGVYSARNTFVWDPYQYAQAITKDMSGNITAEDYTKARLIHWLTNAKGQTSFIPAAVKQPLENYVFMNYPGQPSGGALEGTLAQPSAVANLLDNGHTHKTSFTYNAQNLPATMTDPGARVTTLTYAANNIDVSTIKQGTNVIASYGSYNSQHLPATYAGPDGQTNNIAYNAAGQVIYATNPLGQTRFWEYDGTNRLARVTVQVSVAFGSVVYGATNVTAATAYSFTYDADDRVATRTDSEGLALTYSYDDLDRVTRITYPDSSYDDYDYNFQSGPNVGTPSLDLRKVTDRIGRVTTYDYDAERRLTSVTEPLTSTPTTRTTSYSYYDNGVLQSITDANGNVTQFSIDLQGRLTGKTYAYGTGSAKTETYAYETATSRLKTVTDALSQVKTYAYGDDDLPTGITYTGAINTTPNVTFSWDTVFRRLTRYTDATGITLLTYVPVGTACNPPTTTTNCGATKLASINGAYTNDTISYTYDKLGRMAARTITGGNESFTYDLLGRLDTHGTGMGTFTYGYLNNTGQITSRSVTNGAVTVSTAWSYDTNTNDRQLIGINNSGVTRDYTLSYLIAGGGGARNPYTVQNITDTAAGTHPWATQSHAYTYDLSDRLLTASATTPGNNTFVYDPLDNATTWTDSAGTVNPTYNVFNQLATRGANTYAYDDNGNTLSGDGIKTYKYDAEDRLIEIDYVGGTNKTVFTYNALGQRIVTAETVSGVTTTTRNEWCGAMVCQTRSSADVATRRHYAEGELNVTSGQKLVYMPDQLGSVRDVLDATTGNLVKSYDYAPYGAITRNWGSTETDYRYAGLFFHPNSALNFALFRAQDPATGRWLNRDPIKELGGINLYGYVDGIPTTYADPRGLFGVPGLIFGLGSGAIAGYYSGGWPGAVFGAGIGAAVGIFAPWAAWEIAGGGVTGAFTFAGLAGGAGGLTTLLTNCVTGKPLLDSVAANTVISFTIPLAVSFEAWAVGAELLVGPGAEFAKTLLGGFSTAWGTAADVLRNYIIDNFINPPSTQPVTPHPK